MAAHQNVGSRHKGTSWWKKDFTRWIGPQPFGKDGSISFIWFLGAVKYLTGCLLHVTRKLYHFEVEWSAHGVHVPDHWIRGQKLEICVKKIKGRKLYSIWTRAKRCVYTIWVVSWCIEVVLWQRIDCCIWITCTCQLKTHHSLAVGPFLVNVLPTELMGSLLISRAWLNYVKPKD